MNSEQKRINFNQMVAGYINCALWADVDEENAEKFVWLHLSNEALAVAHVTCQQFLSKIGNYFVNDYSKLGHDLWLTQNGHGSGFFDGDWYDGDFLTECAKLGERYIYLGDDDFLYIG